MCRSNGWSSTRSHRPAIELAVENWRDLDRRMVDAQEARRILDRLYGYEVSPVLWKKVMPRLSAGRVQSVATRMIVDRERARMRFRAAGWWDVEGTFLPAAGASASLAVADASQTDSRTFKATLVAVDGAALAAGRDFTETGELKAESQVRRLEEAEAARPCGQADRPPVHGEVSQRTALQALSCGPVHHLHAPAGSRTKAPLRCPADHAGRPTPLRTGLDHLHADRLDDPVRRGPRGSPAIRPRNCTAPNTCLTGHVATSGR